MKTNKLKIIAIILLCLTMISLVITQCFAEYGKLNTYFLTPPADLGISEINKPTIIENVLIKTYLYIKPTTNETLQVDINARYINNNGTQEFPITIRYKYENGYLQISNLQWYSTNTYSFVMAPEVKIEWNGTNGLYIPIYSYNAVPYTYENKINYYEIYTSTEENEEEIKRQYFELGYTNGYNKGYMQGMSDYPVANENMNIVEQITMLISRFTGNEIAPYITPIAVVLTILMVYFLFIRFLLSLIKAKGVIKVCDITMLVACIIILVCMYLPFVNINITNHNISENVETTSQDVYQINEDTEYRSYVRVIENETGTLYISKYGNIFVPKETENIYKIEEDIITRAVQP